MSEENAPRQLQPEQLRTYLDHNRLISEANATCLDKEADLEIARAEAKRATARAMHFHATLVSLYQIDAATEIVEERTGLIKPKPEPKKA